MTPEHRDNIRAANKRRSKHLCQSCGQLVTVRDGSEVGGLPGVKYRQCNGCGATVAITRRPPRRLP